MDVDVSAEQLRQDWQQPQAETEVPAYLWEDWHRKFNIGMQDPYAKALKTFIANKSFRKGRYGEAYFEKVDDEKLMVRAEGYERKKLHKLCDEIGLHHESRPSRSKLSRTMFIYKPELWRWGYSAANPYSKSPEDYAKQSVESTKAQARTKARLERKYCSACLRTGLEVELLHSVHAPGIFCEECLEHEEDENGHPLNCHKFEAIW
jgi:hypothetical protein